MSVRYRPDRDAWEVAWSDERGRRKRRLLKSEAAARAIEAEIKRTQKELPIQMQGIHLSQAADIWQAHCQGSAATRKNRRERITRCIATIGDLELADLTPQTLRNWQLHRKEQVSQPTAATEAAMLYNLLEFAQANRWLHTNPAQLLDRKPNKNTNSGRELTAAQLTEIIQHTTPRTKIRLLLALDAGLRRGEIRNLRRSNWNEEEQTLRVWSTKTKNWRTIPCTIRLSTALEAAASHMLPDAYLCPSWHGTQLKDGADFVQQIRKRTGITFHLHEMRHTFATRLRRVASFEVTRELLGHQPQTTTDRYIHPTIEEKREAIRKMEEQNAAALDA